MNFKSHPVSAMRAPCLCTATVLASALTVRVIANQGDALSMDPHSLNESLQLTVVGNVYEPLVTRDRDYKLAPALATDWKQTAPTVWRFNLRKGVQFHDGTPFTADDVIFSYERAKGDGSDVKTYVGQIKQINKIDDHAIDIVTNNPFPILPDLFTNWMMSKKWCETNQATKPGGPPQGHRERGLVPRQRHRSVPSARAPAGCPVHLLAQWQLLGQDRRQCGRGDLHAHRQRQPPAWPRCCPVKSTSWSRCRCRMWPASRATPT